MTSIHWANDSSGNFATSGNWIGGVVPGPNDYAILDATGSKAYEVTSSADESVESIQTASMAKLSLAPGTPASNIQFTASEGTGEGANAGTIDLHSYTTFAIGGTFRNTGHITALSQSQGVQLEIMGATTLIGGGAVALDGYSSNGISGRGPGATLTNADNTIEGEGLIDLNGLSLTNEENGVILATNPSPLELSTGSVIANSGLLEGGYGQLILDGTVDNSRGGTILASGGSGGEDTGVVLNGTVIGGNIETSVGAVLVGSALGHDEAELDGASSAVTTTGTIEVNFNSTLSLQGAIVNSGLLELLSNAPERGPLKGGALVTLASTATTLTGGGRIFMGEGSHISGGDLINVDNTIAGAGSIGAGGLHLVNEAEGVIDAVGGYLTIDTGSDTLSNGGTLEATYPFKEDPTGVLIIKDMTVDDSGGGVIEADSGASGPAGGRVQLDGATIIGGRLVTQSGAKFSALNDTVLDGDVGAGTTISGRLSIVGKNSITIEGSIIDQGVVFAGPGSEVIVGNPGATLSGGGAVILSNAGGADVDSVGATTLINVNDRIGGGGTIGGEGLILLNETSGLIASGATTVLVLDTGANVIVNDGRIKGRGAEGLTIASAIDNGGQLIAFGGALKVDGAVTGGGLGWIGSDGTLSLGSSFEQNVMFTKGNEGGVLELAQSQSYAGTVNHFSATGGTELDLRDIDFGGATSVNFTPNSQNTNGVLTVTDGSHTARIRLLGNFSGSTFTLEGDGDGGTIVAAKAAPAPDYAARAQLVSAMAGFASPGIAVPPAAIAPVAQILIPISARV